MSLRSFYRYFPTKEDIVFDWYSELTELLVAKLKARPVGEAPLESLRQTLYYLLEMYDADPKSSYAHLRLTRDNPTLAAKSFEKRLKWQAEFSTILAPRIKGATSKQKASLLTALALSAFYSALEEWQEQNGKPNLRTLMDDSFSITKKILK